MGGSWLTGGRSGICLLPTTTTTIATATATSTSTLVAQPCYHNDASIFIVPSLPTALVAADPGATLPADVELKPSLFCSLVDIVFCLSTRSRHLSDSTSYRTVPSELGPCLSGQGQHERKRAEEGPSPVSSKSPDLALRCSVRTAAAGACWEPRLGLARGA